MKKNRHSLFTGFFAGLLAGASLLSILAFANRQQSPSNAEGFELITSAQAETQIHDYRKDATPVNQVIKGFVINKSQFEAMEFLTIENPSLSGFRIYFGKDSTGTSTAIVLGVDANGKDHIKGSLFTTSALTAGLCPRLCDTESPFNGEDK